MQSNYKRLGDYIREINIRNRELVDYPLLGVSIQKILIPSIANIIGTDMSTYKLIRKNQFAYGPVTSRNGEKISIAVLEKHENALVSQAYAVFEVLDENELHPEYLMMWFKRPEFDRYARFMSHGSAREIFSWAEMCDTLLPVPSPEKQLEIVKEYNVIQDRIKLNGKLITKLEESAQAIYKEWFVEFEFPEIRKVPLSNYLVTNPKLTILKNKISSYIEMNDLSTSSMGIKGFVKRPFIGGAKFQNYDTLLARITPCLENGKTAFVDILEDNEIAGGSTEFIVMRAKEDVSPYWVYCLARDEKFREFAISSMIGSSGRQRVHESYLKEFLLKEIDFEIMRKFDKIMKPVFKIIKERYKENSQLDLIKHLLFAKMTKVEIELAY